MTAVNPLPPLLIAINPLCVVDSLPYLPAVMPHVSRVFCSVRHSVGWTACSLSVLARMRRRRGAMTFARYLQSLQTWQFRRKTKEEQSHYRIETIKALEAPTAEVPLPDRLKLHEVIYALWQSDDPLASMLTRPIADCRVGLQRIRKIVQGLKTFSRRDEETIEEAKMALRHSPVEPKATPQYLFQHYLDNNEAWRKFIPAAT